MPSLLLHTSNPQWLPVELAELIQVLRRLGLVSTFCAEDQDSACWAGESFLSLIMFLGCSPQVQLDPHTAMAGQDACAIRFLTYPKVTFLSAAKRPVARCQHCRTPLNGSDDLKPGSSGVCAQCHVKLDAIELDWRQAAGFGRCFIEISGIYPHEAVPSDKLLNTLAKFSGNNWVYFYR